MESIKKIILTVGLPGSGKTTFCEKYVEANKDKEVNHIEFDKYRKTSYGKNIGFESVLLKRMKEYEDEVLLLDTLLLDNNGVIKSIEYLKDNLEVINDIDIEIHYWNLDRESCLYNDKGRRNENSEITIKNAKLEEMDIESIKKATSLEKIYLITHDVVRKSELQFALDMILDKSIEEIYDEDEDKNKKYLYSKEWLVSGTRRYYTNNYADIAYRDLDGEEAIFEFEQLDEMLEQLCPSLTFIDYKELKKTAVDIEEFDKSDYYIDATYERWRCDLDKLEEYLKSKNYIK